VVPFKCFSLSVYSIRTSCFPFGFFRTLGSRLQIPFTGFLKSGTILGLAIPPQLTSMLLFYFDFPSSSVPRFVFHLFWYVHHRKGRSKLVFPSLWPKCVPSAIPFFLVPYGFFPMFLAVGWSILPDFPLPRRVAVDFFQRQSFFFILSFVFLYSNLLEMETR